MTRSPLSLAVSLVLLAVPPLAGCSAEASPPSMLASPGLVSIPCGVVLSPEPALEAATRSAADDWSAATGCPITLGEGGVPIVLADSIPDADGNEHAGWTSDALDLVLIHRGVARGYHVILHEVGHVLGGLHVASGGVLSGEAHRSNAIDAEALGSVCARLQCAAFNPAAS